MNKALLNDAEVIDLNNNSDGLDKVQPISNATLEEEEEFFDAVEEQEPVSSIEEGGDLGLATSEEEESIYDLEEREEFFDSKAAAFNVPLSIFHYKGYDSDFFTSWYNVSSEIFKEISRACPEKKVLNLALSVLMLPYIAFTALGLVIYSRFKTNDKTQSSSKGNRPKKSEVSESIPKRLAYGILAAIVILVNIAVLVALVIPAMLALATFYLLNRKLSHSLVAAIKISMGLYHNEHQNIEVSFHEIDAGESDIRWDMEIKFPPQFEQLLQDLYKDENGKWFDVTRDLKGNTILKLSANIHLKNGFVPLHDEIRSMLATSVQEFAKTMEELLKLEKKDITYDKLKKLLNEFRQKVVDSVDPKLTSHLIQDAYRVAFIQAIKVAQKRREEKGDFSLEERLKEVLAEQELKSQGKELPTEKEMIIKDLKELKRKEALNLTDEDDLLESLAKIGDIDDISDNALPVLRAKWKENTKILKKTIIDIYSEIYPQETEKAITDAKDLVAELKEKGEQKYQNVKEKLEAMHPKIYQAWNNNNSVGNDLKRKLEDIFKFEPTDQYIYRELIKSRIRKAEVMLSQSDVPINIKQSLLDAFRNLNVNVCSYHEVNLLLEKTHSEVAQCGMLELLKKQDKSIKNIENNTGVLMLFNGEDEKLLVNKIVSYRKEIEEYLTRPAELKKIIEKQNKDLDVEKNNKEKESSSMKLIELCLENNQKILEELERLKLEKEELLINEATKNDYKEELESREKMKFAIIEDDLLDVFNDEAFSEKKIRELLEKAELEYCLAEKCVKYPVIKTKDNIKHFSQDLLSPLIDRLVENIINNVPKDVSKDNESNLLGWVHRKIIKPVQIAWNYNKLGLLAVRDKNSTEGKALEKLHDTYKEVETLLKYFESSYKEVGGLVGDVFSDDGETFKKDIWPQIKSHLLGMWDRFFKDIEFTLVSGISQEAVGTKLDGPVTQKHGKFLGSVNKILQ